MVKTKTRPRAAARKEAKSNVVVRRRTPAQSQSTAMTPFRPKLGAAGLTTEQRTELQGKFADDEFMLERVQNLAAMQNQTGTMVTLVMYEMGRVLREIKGKRRDAGIKQTAEALGRQPQGLYDAITLHERIPEKTLHELLKQSVNYTTLNNIAHCPDAKTRNALIRRLLDGEKMTVRNVRLLLQEAAPKDRKGKGKGKKFQVPKKLVECAKYIVSSLTVISARVPQITDVIREKLSTTTADSLKPADLTELNSARESLAHTVNLLRSQLQEVELALEQYRGNTGAQTVADEDAGDDDVDDDDVDVSTLDDDGVQLDDALAGAMSLDDVEDAADVEQEEDDEHVRRRSTVARRVQELRRPTG